MRRVTSNPSTASATSAVHVPLRISTRCPLLTTNVIADIASAPVSSTAMVPADIPFRHTSIVGRCAMVIRCGTTPTVSSLRLVDVRRAADVIASYLRQAVAAKSMTFMSRSPFAVLTSSSRTVPIAFGPQRTRVSTVRRCCNTLCSWLFDSSRSSPNRMVRIVPSVMSRVDMGYLLECGHCGCPVGADVDGEACFSGCGVVVDSAVG